ncbi:ABC transporter ATP-binding protein [Thioclava sp. SK-1]|uniref:iron ABC transporter ATP-binding protein n=1 Tax=Thioclava sp. SK-1 TaxID=1889770 RepID=UPI0008255B32|nr:ATP-binding cassette domain-containing protein [Thioclava sp. SK-1]OCX62288.1 ABC transporter ATP-binding protein [Thioclava sp. SK-1]
MIEIKNVSYAIGGAKILQDINTVIPKGSVTALIGPNGAGKSSLLNLIGRIEPLQTGTIDVDGQNVTTSHSGRLARTMAFLGQHTAVASRLRVSELVAFGRWPHCHGRPGPEDHEKVADAIAQFSLRGLADRFLDELSGGQAQRAHLAMTFAQDTPWVLLDEPLNNLDMAHSRILMRKLSDLRDAGKSVVIVVHDLNQAAAWADHLVAMKHGRVVVSGAPDEVLTPDWLSALYDTEVQVLRYADRPLVLSHV